MIPKECKRLAEVDFPIALVSKYSAGEKYVHLGHPNTLHLWWARRPLAACRAMLMALLLPDPCDENCPDHFKKEARKILLAHPGRPQKWDKTTIYDSGLQKILFQFIADFSKWDNSSNQDYIRTSHNLISAVYRKELPLVVDPFAGGGSVPLEALRMGCDVFASDLNPVACLILKVLLDDIPRNGLELVDKLRILGEEVQDQAVKELGEYFPKDPDHAIPIAYLWARTVRCEAPNCGAEIPLMRSLWLCKKGNRKRALRYKINISKTSISNIEFDVFEPKTDTEVFNGTVSRAKAKCLCCNTVLNPERVRAQLNEQSGGADVVFDKNGNRIGGARLLAVVTVKDGKQGRNYRLPSDQDYKSIWRAQKQIVNIIDVWNKEGNKGLFPFPDEPLPPIGTLGFRVQRYGMLKWGDLFTARQKVALKTLLDIIVLKQKSLKFKVPEVLACAFDRVVMSDMSCTRWNATAEKMQHTFGRQALPIVWDFAEVVPIAPAPGNWESGYSLVVDVIERFSGRPMTAQVQQADAANSPLPNEACRIWFTDPPYYDAVPYADLSDFFFVWIKRLLKQHPLLHDPFNPANILTPKAAEAVQNERTLSADNLPKDRNFYEGIMARSFTEGRRVLCDDGIGCVVFAHKTTEGWEALLSGMIKGGWTITGSWPIATEMGSRLRSRDSAALATSVHLICRPRSDNAPIGDWFDILGELPMRVGNWMERLQSENVRGADLVFACIGPALEIFSRYSKVETAEGIEVSLTNYLEKVWEVVGRTALEQVLGTEEARARNGMAGVLEEDARLTALFLWTIQSTNGQNGSSKDEHDEEDDTDDEEDTAPRGKAKGGYSLIFDVVRRFAQPLGIDLPKWEGRIIETKKGVVRLMSVSERSKQIFGEDGADAAADWITEEPERISQMVLFPELEKEQAPKIRGRRKAKVLGDITAEAAVQSGITTLDKVHAAMLLQAGGKANALRALIKEEQNRGPDFLRLANALSALYPKGSEEKRLLDAMLLAVPR